MGKNVASQATEEFLDPHNLNKTKEYFSKIIAKLEHTVEFVDILFMDFKQKSLRRDIATQNVEDTAYSGIKIRAFDGNCFNEIHLNDYNIKNIDDEIDKFYHFLKSNTKVKHNLTKKESFVTKHFQTEFKEDPNDIPIDKKVELLEKTVNKIKDSDQKIVNARAVYTEESMFKIYASNSKFLSQKLNSVIMALVPMIKCKDGETRTAFGVIFGNGYEATKRVNEKIKSVCKEALQLYETQRLKPGKFTAVLSPEISGLLAHESMGHGMEADTVYKDRALAKEWQGKKITDADVSIVDDPSYPKCYGTYFFDDEGELATRTYLLKDGVINHFITDYYSATKLGIRCSPNGRCQRFDHKNYARMSNTFFDKGKSKEEDLFKKIKDGIYLIKASGGMEDPKGWGVQIQGIFCQRIKNGKLVDEFYNDVSITGFLPDILRNITDVSDTIRIEDIGHCGKGHKEWVPVSTGGPFIVIKDLELS